MQRKYAIPRENGMKKVFIIISLPIIMCFASAWMKASIQDDAPEMAPDFTLPDINGNDFTLSSMRGKYVVLDFWGTWCKICMKGMPKLKEAQKKYKGKFEIIGVDCGDKTVKWRHWVDSLKNDMPWKHVIMGRKLQVQQEYRIKGYPTKILIDPDGKIVKSFVGEDPRFYLMLEEVFGK